MSPVRRSFKWWKRDSEWKTAFHTRWHIQPLNGYVAINVDWLFLMTTFQLRFDIHLSLFICVCLDGFFVDATTVAITNNNDNFFSFVVIFVCSSLFLFYVFFFFFDYPILKNEYETKRFFITTRSSNTTISLNFAFKNPLKTLIIWNDSRARVHSFIWVLLYTLQLWSRSNSLIWFKTPVFNSLEFTQCGQCSVWIFINFNNTIHLNEYYVWCVYVCGHLHVSNKIHFGYSFFIIIVVVVSFWFIN